MEFFVFSFAKFLLQEINIADFVCRSHELVIGGGLGLALTRFKQVGDLWGGIGSDGTVKLNGSIDKVCYEDFFKFWVEALY